MKFVYKPEGLAPREWEFEPDRQLISAECMAIEKLTGLEWGEWKAAVKKESVRAMHAYLWVLLKKDNPTLLPKQVAFSVAEVAFEPSDDEIRKVFESFAEKPDGDWDDEDRETIAALQTEYPHLVPDEVAAEDGPGPESLDDEQGEVIPDPKD